MGSGVLEAIARATRREQALLAGSARPNATYDAEGSEMAELPEKLGAIEAAHAVFEATGVRYALIGGVAVGIRSGVPRATLDVDFAVPTDADLDALSAALVAAGFVMKGRFAHSINFVHASGEPVQIAFDPGFDPFVQRAELLSFGAIDIRVVTMGDLIAMKRRAAADPSRPRSKALRDAADVALLEGDVPGDDDGW